MGKFDLELGNRIPLKPAPICPTPRDRISFIEKRKKDNRVIIVVFFR